MTREEQAQYICEKLMKNPEFRKAFVGAITDAVNEVVKVIKALQQEPCEMTVEEYRQRMIQAFHNADCDELIALVVLPTEKEFEHLEWLLENHYKAKPEPCTDAISREDTLKAMIEQLGIKNEDYLLPAEASLYKVVKNMPPVTLQLCEDAISRANTIEEVSHIMLDHPLDGYEDEQLILKTIQDMPPVTLQLCEDAISRANTIEEVSHIMLDHPLDGYEDEQLILKTIQDMPPITPQPKMQEVSE